MIVKILQTIVPKPIRNAIWKIIPQKKKEPFILEVQVADHCNLNCVGCSHFTPLADESFLDVESYNKDCRQFASVARKLVTRVSLLGGEPLLHRDIVSIMKITRKYFTRCTIWVVTNGILLPQMPEAFWECCHRYNITISITKYPIHLEINKIKELANKHKVELLYDEKEPVEKFRKDVYDLQGRQNPTEMFAKCTKKVCHHLYKGMFYMCPIVPLSHYFTKYFKCSGDAPPSPPPSQPPFARGDMGGAGGREGASESALTALAGGGRGGVSIAPMTPSPADYLDIYKIKKAKEIVKYIKNPIPFCRYCDMNKTKYDIEWGLSKKVISEWV